MQKKLMRDPNNKMIAGVCSGIADYFGVDPTLVRAVFAISLVFGGAGFFVYILLWIIMPEGPVIPVPPAPQQWAGQYPSPQYPNPQYPVDPNAYPGNPYRQDHTPPYSATQWTATDQAGDQFTATEWTGTDAAGDQFTTTEWTESDDNGKDTK